MQRNKHPQTYRSALSAKLQALGLAASYHRAEGDYLYQQQGGSERQILDLVGGYGANLLGHFHPKLATVATHYFSNQAPILAQGTISPQAERLNNQLRGRFGNYTVILTNTGAETVEAALKHAHLENGKSRCWALCNAYHGKSLGTLPFSHIHNRPFGQQGLEIDFLDPNDPDTWAQALAQAEEVSFAIAEPVQGEAGIRPLPTEFVDWLNAATAQYGIPIIVDEIQSGLGRTGAILASEQIGLRRDYLCLSKALGGGIAKVGALLVEDRRFVPEFAILNTSTFSDDGFSTAIASQVLEIIEAEKLPEQCAAKGGFLKAELIKLQAAYPGVLKSVRGMGLMLGVEFHAQKASASNLLRNLSGTPYFGYAIASHLLARHRLRIMPTLSNPNTLRLQPSAYVSEAAIAQVVKGIKSVCEVLVKADAGYLVNHLAGRETAEPQDYRPRSAFRHQPPEGNRRAAFVGHFISAQDLVLWDPSFDGWAPSQLEHLISRAGKFLDPVIFDEVNVVASTGDTVHLSFIGLFLDSREIEAAYRSRNYQWVNAKIERAAEIAETAGCQVLGLGGFTSILMKNGKQLNRPALRVTTGNSLTVGFGLAALYRAARLQRVALEEASVAIVGAGGNIANTYAALLAEKVKKIILVPRLVTHPKVAKLKEQLQRRHPGLIVEITDQMQHIGQCELVVASSNSSRAVILPAHLSGSTKVICDLAVPADVAASVAVAFPDILLLKGGIVKLPRDEDFIIGGIPLPRGHIFACMGETLLMGLDQGRHFPGSVGAVCPKGVRQAMALAERFGFELGGLKIGASY